MWVEGTRGSVVETRHRVHAAIVDTEGRIVATSGDPDLVTFWRSGAKPFQAMPLVRDGGVERFGVTAAELAVACSSHSAEPRHLELVRSLLARADLSERDLLCGPHPPLSEAVARDYAKRGVRLTAIHSNCSGNHAAMLVLARHHNWPSEFYIRADHPVQQRCLAEVAEWSSVSGEHIGTAVDGCGVVCFALPLRAMALGYATLGREANARSDSRGEAASTIVQAMLRHPEIIAGEGRACTDLMQAHPGRVVTKAGAAGVHCALLVQEEVGIALKVEDGQGAAAALAMAAILAELGLRPQPERLVAQPITNTRGEVVGELRTRGGLEGVAASHGRNHD
ncbi:MAG TPA: asparaginase [Gemmatimonadales bacterium]|nr:asparaginase [Gemmatimonadales bacterium]